MKIIEKNMKKQKTDHFESTTKPPLFLGEASFLLPLICKNEPNFNTSNIIATSYITVVYNDLLPEFRQKKRTQNEPKRTQFTCRGETQ